MKKLILTLSVVFIFSLTCLSQDSHLTLIYDFEGLNFDYTVKGMVGINDSLYIVSNTPNNQGMFFRIDENGDGFKVIWEFDDVNYDPFSLVGNDTVIYGTTRFSNNKGGTLFKYCLQSYSFEIIKDFDWNEVMEVQIKYITDSVLWLSSQWSIVDEGSIFTVEKDGTQLNKIYNDTNLEKGQHPKDFVFHNDSIYIAFFSGGGIPYPDGVGSFVASGSFARIKYDGTGFETLVKGQDGIGTNPSSLIIRENKIIGLFAYSGSNYEVGGQFFRCNLDGTDYDSLGALKGRALTKMFSTDSLIYGISLSQIFGVNPFSGEIRIFDELFSNPDWGYDVVANPAFLNGYVFVSAQQGGPDDGGTILRWTNKPPEIIEKKMKNMQITNEIILDNMFVDPEGDSISYSFEYNNDELALSLLNGKLDITTLKQGEFEIIITAYDGWGGYKSNKLTVSSTVSILVPDEKPDNLILFPNPTNSILSIAVENIELIQIYTLDGKLIKSFQNPGNEINISSLDNGIYLLRYRMNGNFYSEKIIKF